MVYGLRVKDSMGGSVAGVAGPQMEAAVPTQDVLGSRIGWCVFLCFCVCVIGLGLVSDDDQIIGSLRAVNFACKIALKSP